MSIHQTEAKSISTTYATNKSISFYTGIKSSSIPHTEIKSIRTTHTKWQSVFMLTLKSSDFRPAYKKKLFNFDHAHNEINFIPKLKRSHFRQPTQQLNRFHPTPESGQVRSARLKWSQFGPPTQKKQVNFHAHTKNKWFSASTQGTSQFLPPTQPNQFHP